MRLESRRTHGVRLDLHKDSLQSVLSVVCSEA